ncbi:MAG: PAS domain S-box protein, partial [Candidatus Latescibacteria bacterium]|nr:PAS domain S-box protein [Candidatus Latescibacterota bacterium]
MLFFPLCGALTSVGLFYTFLSRTEEDVQLVGIAGRQALLAEQLRDYATMVHLGQAEDRAGLRKLVDNFDHALSRLEGEEAALENERLFVPQELEDELDRVKQLWREFKPSLLLIAEHPVDDAQAVRAYTLIETTTPLLIKAADQVIAEFIRTNGRLRQQVLLYLNIVVGLDAILLLFGIWATKNYVTERRQVEKTIRVNLAVQQVRDAVLQMQNPEDWSGVGAVLERQLRELVAFDGAGIAIVNREYRSFYAYALTESSALRGELCEFLPRALDQALVTGKPILRRNRAEMEAWGDNIGPERNSVVDVPFGRGTLSLNSAREDAFSGRDIAVLERFAGVIAEAHLRLEFFQQLKRFAAIIEESADFIGMCDPQGRMLYLNQAGRRMVGVGEDEDITLTKAPDYLPERLRGLISIIATQGVWQGEGALRRRDGNEFPVLYTALAHHGVDGKIETLSSIARDISERQRAEEEIRVNLALQQVRNHVLQMEDERDWENVVLVFYNELKHLLEFEDCSLNLVDLQGGSMCLYIVDQGYEVVHRSAKVPLAVRKALETGKPVYRPSRSDPLFPRELAERYNSVLDVPFSGGTLAINSTREKAFRPQDIQLLEHVTRVLNEAHRRLEDLRNLALQEKHLRQAQKLEAIGELATGVAHEINNPLTSVIGYSELMLAGELAPQVREHLETIYREGRRAAQIVERLLSFTRRQQSNKHWQPLNLLVHEALGLVRQSFEVGGVQLREELAEGLSLVEVHAGQLQQVVLGLVQNSREAILQAKTGGSVTVRTGPADSGVRLEVEDDGPGIPEEIRERIFEPFFTTKRVGQGPGLGLSLCFAIVREHSGRLWIEPRQPGARAVLELPTDPSGPPT